MDRETLFFDSIYGKVLDIGCFQGKLNSILRQKKGVTLFGLDVVKCQMENFKKGDMEKNPFKSGFFDCVTAGEVLEHVKNPELALKESRRVLKKGGCLLLSTPNKKAWLNILFKAYEEKAKTTGHGHEKIFTPEELKQWVENAGFKVEKLHVFPYNGISISSTRYPSFFAIRKAVSFFLPKKYREQIAIKAIAR